MVIFYCDLYAEDLPTADLPDSIKVERKKSQTELELQDFNEIVNFWNPKLAEGSIQERFAQGASLWLIKSGDKLAGYSWTIRGRSIAPYYFPMSKNDVQLFDFYVFRKFRGRAILWFLITCILGDLRGEGAARVFGDVAEWNQPSLSFYKTIPFRRLGIARKFSVFGHTIVWWAGNQTVDARQSESVGHRTVAASLP